ACGQTLGRSRGRQPRRAGAAPEQARRRRKSASSSSITNAHIIENPKAGERKIITALFADIKGSMELMQDLDPEEARGIVDPALQLMVEAVRHYDGHVVQSTGDGIFALFGAPVAHEDHPQRALYAALRMRENMHRYTSRLREAGSAPVEVRIGVNTGEAVMRAVATGKGHVEYTPIGHSTSLAARMQTLAPTGSIAITSATQKLCEGYFQFENLGPTRIKGVSEPVTVYEVTGLGPLRTRLQAAARRGFTRFVGRAAELEQMQHAWELARTGHGQVVAAPGEPGVGKSRLLAEFKARVPRDCMVLEAYSASHGKATAYLPVIELLRDYFEINSEDDGRKRRERILGKLLGLGHTLEDTLPYLYGLLGVSETNDPLAQMDPQVRQRRTQEAIKRILLRESLNQPLVVTFEDLHWIDTETQALLNLLVDSIANARILLLVNYRPEYRHEWGSRTYYAHLRLDPLGKENAGEMLSALLGDKTELQPLKQLIAQKTEGNPFFIEEMVQTLFEQGALIRNGRVTLARPLAQITIPTTVQAVLASRIDRLAPDEKELLHTMAVLGREFPLPLIRQVAGKSQEGIRRMLNVLQAGEFIYEQPAFPDPEYIFKHALTQEVAYNSVLIERRKLLHERAGAAIESLYAAGLDEHLEELAHHYNRSDNIGKAVEYSRLAGGQALKRSHHAEAIARATTGLQLLSRLPAGSNRTEAELGLQLTLGLASMAVLGYSASEVGNALERAATLARQSGSGRQTFAVVGGLWAFYLVRADHHRANQLASEMLEIAGKDGSEVLSVEAHFALGVSLFWAAKFAESQEHLELGSSTLPHSSPINILVADTPAFSSAYLANCLWHLGVSDRAAEIAGRALERADSLKDPFTAATIRFGVVQHALLNISADAAQREAEKIIAIGVHHGFPFQETTGKIFRNCALLHHEGDRKILTELADLAQAQNKVGIKLAFPFFFAFLAKGYADIGNPEQGLRIIDETLDDIELTSEYHMKAELNRLKGELLLMQAGANASEAERYFRSAIDIARSQQAKSWELRATMSLARLLAKQHRRGEARSTLAEIYGWFTEGFDTPDLKEAKSLLDELNGR
ncbi:MAG: AAA family ATPase, partial [Deltaproteobacteria bacterium]|nr:AAA family ATPase [Deltaproteobacteria bacterium]